MRRLFGARLVARKLTRCKTIFMVLKRQVKKALLKSHVLLRNVADASLFLAGHLCLVERSSALRENLDIFSGVNLREELVFLMQVCTEDSD